MANSERKIDQDASELDALIGRVVGGRFLVTNRIARGGMALVYAGTQIQVDRPVAIKVMCSNVAAGDVPAEEFQRRFLQEASILSRLQHPNLVTLLDYGRITEVPGDHYYIAMEFLEGETLAHRLRFRGRLTITETVRIARQVGRGLREAHRHGFVHRDLKPSNIMLVPEDDDNDIIKLIDFGIGKVLSPLLQAASDDSGEQATRVGMLLGNPRYMAPEQIRGEAIEPRTDLYGLGVVLFQALTGRVPFVCTSEAETMVAHCSLPPPPVDAYLEEPTAVSLSDLVRDLLKKNPAERPTVQEFLLRLDDVESELFGSVGVGGPTFMGTRRTLPPPPSSFPPALNSEPLGLLPEASSTPSGAGGLRTFRPPAFDPPPPPARSRWMWGALGLCLLAFVLVFSVVLLMRSSVPTRANAPPPPPPTSSSAPHLAAVPSSSFVLRLDSLPTSAVVSENGVTLGVTPLKLVIERSSVSGSPRRLTLEHEGYEPQTLEQADSDSDVDTLAHLLSRSAPSVRPSTQRARPTLAPAPTSPEPLIKQPPPRRDERLDINLER